MLRIILGLFLMLASPAYAQQQQDPQITVYRQLLDNANAQLAQAVVQLQEAKQKIADMQKQLDEKSKK